MSSLVARKRKTMQQNKSKLAAVVLVAAIGLGAPALAKSLRGANPVGSHTNQIAKRQRGRVPDVIGAGWRASTFGVPNPNHPSLTGGGSTGYNANLYVY